MDGRLPLPTLLSQALVAFIIEFDNEFERQMPHRTTNHGSTPGSKDAPWLVSMVMWTKFMCYIPDDGVSVAELRSLLGMSGKGLDAWLTRLGRWWGFIVVDRDAVVRPISAGRKAQEVWRPLTATIEKRWQERFGKEEIGHLRESLWAVASQLDPELPDSLPILGFGLFSKPDQEKQRTAERANDKESWLPLPALLSKVLLAFAIEFERESRVSLAICANVLRLLDEEGVHVRDLPSLAGVSKEAIATSLSFLVKRRDVVMEVESGKRFKVAVLTAKGRHAQDTYNQLVWAIEERWQTRFGEDSIRKMREALEQLGLSPLLRGLKPHPDGWRASVPSPTELAHYPMILHRGGFPDGS